MIRFVDQTHSKFFQTVTKRVNAYFEKRNLSKYANKAMLAKSTLFIVSAILLYSLILSEVFPWYIQLPLAMLLGMNQAFIGFNICHDAIHGAYFRNKKANELLSLCFNLIGANAYVWKITHNMVHHTYTNIPGHDEDLEIAPGLIRLLAGEKKRKFQKYQHIYAFFLYSFASLSWVFRKDYVKFFQKRIGHYAPHHPWQEYFKLFFFKALYYTLFIVIPLVAMELSWWQFLCGFLAMHLAEGLVLGLVFQLAHVVEGTTFPTPGQKGDIKEAWAIHQMRTTANFARHNRLITFLCGGLNYQVEHHLFPNICHIHYPAITGIVEKTAKEFGLPYLENKTFRSALRAHGRFLKKMGRYELTEKTYNSA